MIVSESLLFLPIPKRASTPCHRPRTTQHAQIRRRRATPAIVPTTIPAMAPPLSPPDVPAGLTAPVVVEAGSAVPVDVTVPLVTRYGALN
jgi:hypothetical protein